MRQLLLRACVSILISSTAAALAHDAPKPIPAPAADNPRQPGQAQTAVLAGGCYWGMQGVFERVKGVRQVVAGFSGMPSGEDQLMHRGGTPAESVQITFDPNQISYGQILQIYFSVAHDPTEVDRQGPDVGPQYRSVIYYSDDTQQKIAQSYIQQLQSTGSFGGAIATQVEPLVRFHRVADSEQDYTLKHPASSYVLGVDMPKLAALKSIFPSLYLESPVTLSGSSPS
ncbi:MAG TPA: peptide-methionine (S)-S-oxide reductase MsrA [Rhizomicrobium sp.]|jgi:peptide-methionine (S)-S-oxide reductase|nr:peptide-methionine (S)-S-oxide reductase MsrA [Rhizomicrobium sp.]